MACKIAGMTSGGFGMFGGMLGGIPGIASVAPTIMAVAANGPTAIVAQAAMSAASGAVGDTGLDPLTAISSGTLGAITSAAGGSGIAAALTAAVPSGLGDLASKVTDSSSLITSITAHASEFMPVDISAGLQIFNQVQSFSGSSIDIMPTITRALNTDFGGITGLTKDFTDGGFLGDSIGNFDELLTNGIGSLTDGLGASFPDLGAGFASLGKFGDVSNFANLMQPGQIASQLLSEGLGDIGNIATKLEGLGIPLDDLSNPLYQGKIQEVMNGITNITDLADIQEVMGSGINLNNLGQLTDVTKVLDNNIGKSFSSFADLGTKLGSIDTGSLASLGDLGDMMGGMAGGSDLTNILGQTDLLSPEYFSNISGVFGNGTGPDGSVLMRDVMGIAAGYGIEDYIPSYKQAIDQLSDLGVTADVQSLYGQLSAGLGGAYTDVSAGTINDPLIGIFATLDDWASAKQTQITDEFTIIGNNSSPTVQNLIDTSRNNWIGTADKLNTELENIAISDIDTSLVSPGNKATMLSFARQLPTYGQDGSNRAEFLAKSAAPTQTGDFLKLGLREGQNLAQFAEYGIGYAGQLNDDLEPINEFNDTQNVAGFTDEDFLT